MSQEIDEVMMSSSQEATIRVSEEVSEHSDGPEEYEVDNIRIRDNGWVDLWTHDQETYARSLPPDVVCRIEWGQLDE